MLKRRMRSIVFALTTVLGLAAPALADDVIDGSTGPGSVYRLVRPTVAAFTTSSPSNKPRMSQRTLSDIVCGTAVSEESAWGWSEYGGQRYYFCSQGCKMEFDDNPAGHTRE